MTGRHSWPVRRYRLGEEPGDDLSHTTSVAERLRMVDELSAEAWGLAGKPVPGGPRAELPVVRRALCATPGTRPR